MEACANIAWTGGRPGDRCAAPEGFDQETVASPWMWATFACIVLSSRRSAAARSPSRYTGRAAAESAAHRSHRTPGKTWTSPSSLRARHLDQPLHADGDGDRARDRQRDLHLDPRGQAPCRAASGRSPSRALPGARHAPRALVRDRLGDGPHGALVQRVWSRVLRPGPHPPRGRAVPRRQGHPRDARQARGRARGADHPTWGSGVRDGDRADPSARHLSFRSTQSSRRSAWRSTSRSWWWPWWSPSG